MSTTEFPPSGDPLTALVERLPATDAERDHGASTEPAGCSPIDASVQVGPDVRLECRRGEFYFALVRVGQEVQSHRLDLGLGRLVWTLATAAPTPACERARRVLAEAGIGATDTDSAKC